MDSLISKPTQSTFFYFLTSLVWPLKPTDWQLTLSPFGECTGKLLLAEMVCFQLPCSGVVSQRAVHLNKKVIQVKKTKTKTRNWAGCQPLGPACPYMSALTNEANIPSSCSKSVSGLSYSMMLPRFITMTRSAVRMVWTRCWRHTGTTQNTNIISLSEMFCFNKIIICFKLVVLDQMKDLVRIL